MDTRKKGKDPGFDRSVKARHGALEKARRNLRFFLRLLWDLMILTFGREKSEPDEPSEFGKEPGDEFDMFSSSWDGMMA